MASEAFELAVLLSLKDGASSGLDRFQAKLRAAGKDGKKFTKTFDDLRNDLSKAFQIGSIGLAGLGVLGKGVQVAADFQSSMTDMKATLAQTRKDGSIDLTALGKDMQQAEALALKLGNALPGTTEDFVGMISKLKSGGLEAKTIFDGVGESVASLAVANNEVPTAIADDFSKFVQIYKISAEESKQVADLMSRIYTSKGVTSGALVQSSKYFQGRAGTALGMSGLKGAQESVRLMAYLQKQGLDDSQAGTSASTFFVQLSKNKTALEQIRKEYGITLDLFDEGRNFKGIDNAVRELEKFKQLNPEQMLVALNKLGGEEGSMAGTAIVKGGSEAWKQFNGEVDKSISLQQKTAMKSEDFNNKLEALTGTAKNLVVTAFEPMLPPLTRALETGNDFVGALQGIAKENPGLMKILGSVLGIGSAGLVGYSAFKTLTTGVKMFKLATHFSKGGGLVSYLDSVKTGADASSKSLGAATKKAGGFKGALAGIGGVIAVTAIVDYSVNRLAANEEFAETRDGIYQKGIADFKNFSKRFEDAKRSGKQLSASEFDAQSKAAWDASKKAGLRDSLGGGFKDEKFFSIANWSGSTVGRRVNRGVSDGMDPFGILQFLQGSKNDFRDRGGLKFSAANAEGFKKSAPQLANADVMAAFLRKLPDQIRMESDRNVVKDGLKNAFPESFARALEIMAQQGKTSGQNEQQNNSAAQLANLAQNSTGLSAAQVVLLQSTLGLGAGMVLLQQQAKVQGQNAQVFAQQGQAVQSFGQSLSSMSQPMGGTSNNIANLGSVSNRSASGVNRLGISANSIASNLSSVSSKLASWQPPTPRMQSYSVPQTGGGIPSSPFSIMSGIPSRSIGGMVERDGIASVHAGNVITPAKITKGLKSGSLGGGITVNYSAVVKVAGSANAEEIKDALYKNSKELERILSRVMNRGRERA